MAARMKWSNSWEIIAVAAVSILVSGCATCGKSAGRSFDFGADQFAFTNQLSWEYEFGEGEELTVRKADPAPDYHLRCFPMTRLAREFFYHAMFAPELTALGAEDYHHLAKEISGRNSRCPSADEERIVIPGYRNLFEFSAAHPELLRENVGGPIWSYLQRGNWRMIFPVVPFQRERTAKRLIKEIREGRLPIVHVYRFPEVSLNHGIMLFAAEEEDGLTRFLGYDPNNSRRPARLDYDWEKGKFLFERNRYFAGGRAEVYEVYRGICH